MDLVAVALYAAGVLGPLAWVWLHSLSLTPVYEESIGYRYFYSLRELYEGTYLFVPQGQLADLIFKLVQVALSLGGVPPTQIRPRIDYFSLASLLLLHLVNVAAFATLVRTSGRTIPPVLAALFWLLPFYAPGAPGAYLLLMPDYLTLAPAVAMLSAAAMLAGYGGQPVRSRYAVALALLLGGALATKVTLAILPAVVLLFLALSRPLRAGHLPQLVQIGAAGLAIWLLIVGADLGFNPRSIYYQARDLGIFIRHGEIALPDEPWLAWMWSRARELSAVAAGVYLTPAIVATLLLFARSRKSAALAVSLLGGALLYSAVLYGRDYFITVIESSFYTFLCLWCALEAGMQSLQIRFNRRLIPQGFAANAVMILACGAVTVILGRTYAASTLSVIDETTRAEQVLAQARARTGGRQLWLVPDNTVRPISIDSAIMKGGSGKRGIWLEPDSALVRAAAPDLDFRFERSDSRPARASEYAAVLFISRGALAARVQELNARYGLDLSAERCREVVAMQTGTAMMCDPR